VIRDVGPLEEFPEWQMRILSVEGREIGIVRLGRQVYALRNVCPHQTGPLCRGLVFGKVVAAGAGRVEVDREHPVVTCPWHGWEFDLMSGRCLTDRSKRVAVYPTEVRENRVFLRTGESPRS
jgi:nitrite reductase (NADH) small subunit